VRQLFLMVITVASVDIFTTVDIESELCVLGRDVLNDFRLVASPKENMLTLEPCGSAHYEERAVPRRSHASLGWWASAKELKEATTASHKPFSTSVPILVPLVACAAAACAYVAGVGPKLVAMGSKIGF